jgi:hypothetical protein
MNPRVSRLVLALGIPGVLSGCGLLFSESGLPTSGESEVRGSPEARAGSEGTEVPAGFGTLRQDDVSIDLRHGELQIKITPLDESVTRTTAPDTYERLSALARGHHEIFEERTGSALPFQLFLVALFSEAVEVEFEPEDLNLVSRGLRFRPVDIRPITRAWDSRRVQPREVLMAIYAFPAQIDLDRELEVEFREIRSREWDRILGVVEAERARVRARAGGGAQPSIPNFFSFR